MKKRILIISLAIFILLGAWPSQKIVNSATGDTLEDQIEEAIVKGLAWLASQQYEDGHWGMLSWTPVARTGLVLLAFETRAINIGLNPLSPVYEYSHLIDKGLDFLDSTMYAKGIFSKPPGNPDGDGDGIGIAWSDQDAQTIYVSGYAMTALAASGHPELYGESLQDAVDLMAFSQKYPIDPYFEKFRGGWDEMAHPSYLGASNIFSGYATLGLGYAAATPPYGFGLTIPDFVKDELSFFWIPVIQDDVDGDINDGGSYNGSSGGESNILYTGNLLYMMALVGDRLETRRVQDAIDYIERHWNDAEVCGTGWIYNCQAMFAMMKGFEAFGIELIDVNGDGMPETDWYEVVANHLINTQNADGSWSQDCQFDNILSTAWALLVLERAVPRIQTSFSPSVDEFGFKNFGYNLHWLTGIDCEVLGHCSGMAYASLYYYYLDVDTWPWPRNINKCEEELPSNFQRAYIEWLQAEFFGNPFNIAVGVSLLLNPPESEEIFNNYKIIRDYISQTNLPYPILLLDKESNIFHFHTVLVYRVWETSDTTIKLYIYDSNHPYCEFGFERFIALINDGNVWQVHPYDSYQFDKFRLLNPFNLADLGWALILRSPGYLEIIDPDDLIMSPSLNQIEGAVYITSDIDEDGQREEIVAIGNPKEGEYTIKVLPKPGVSLEETYTLEAYSAGSHCVIAENVPLLEAPQEGYITSAPTSCEVRIHPLVLNIKSKGRWVTAYIELPIHLDVREIDVNSITLNNAINAELHPIEITDNDRDGIPDLMVKFDRQNLVSLLVPGDQKLMLSGSLNNGTIFNGIAHFRLIGH